VVHGDAEEDGTIGALPSVWAKAARNRKRSRRDCFKAVPDNNSELPLIIMSRLLRRKTIQAKIFPNGRFRGSELCYGGRLNLLKNAAEELLGDREQSSASGWDLGPIDRDLRYTSKSGLTVRLLCRGFGSRQGSERGDAGGRGRERKTFQIVAKTKRGPILP